MKKIVLPVLLLLYFHTGFSQVNVFQKEINEQVWKPFIKSFNAGDNDAFAGVHSKEVIRVSQDDNNIIGYSEYFKKIPTASKQNGVIGSKISNYVLSNA